MDIDAEKFFKKVLIFHMPDSVVSWVHYCSIEKKCLKKIVLIAFENSTVLPGAIHSLPLDLPHSIYLHFTQVKDSRIRGTV